MIFYIALFLLSGFLTFCVRRWALRVGCMDVPSERSAHVIPTPRGGGIAFVVCFFLGLFALRQLVPFPLMLAILTASVPLALLGYLDDRYHLSAEIRLLMQLLCASLSLYCLGFSGIASLFFVVGAAWLINLFNFMDGIDGYAAMEAIFLACSLAFFYGPTLSPVMFCLCASVLGFLLWNFPKAKIFMGDVGSGFLGAIFAISLSYIFLTQSFAAFAGALILMALFVVDSSLTLARRIWRLEPIWQAHKQHAYQRLAEKWQSHVPVTLMGLAMNLFWLLPISYCTTFQLMPIWLGGALSYGGLAMLWLWL